ncbi:MAG: hypothetical protein ABIQ89_02860 [Candidatus Saccharimonadales bacterium]
MSDIVELSEFPPQSQPMAEELATVTTLHPPKEGVFDSGKHHFFQGEIEVGNDAVTWTLEVPENLVYEGLAIFVPGYSGIKGSSRGPRGAMASEGYATATYSPSRHGSSWYETARNPQILHAKTIKAIGKSVAAHEGLLQHAPNIKTIGDGKKILLAHSMGGLGATEYGIHNPEDVDAIFKLAAVGYGHPTLKELLQDVPTKAHLGLWHELIPTLRNGDIAPNLRNVRDMIRYFGGVRALLEGNSCLRHDSRDDVAALREAGIFIGYQAYRYDILVRADESVADHVDHHSVMENAGHLAPIYKSQLVARHIAHVLQNIK